MVWEHKMNAQETRELTQSAKEKIIAEEEILNHRRNQLKELVTKNARSRATQIIEEVFVAIKVSANKGNRDICYRVGEKDEDNFYRQLANYLETDLKLLGYAVEQTQTTNSPYGSDPYRYDTYVDIDLKIGW